MKATIETIREIVKVLTADEQQLLKDTIKHGYWGDASAAFVDEELGDIITIAAEIYITNDAKKGGHFSGRRVSAMFRSIYKKMCSACDNQAGIHLSHCSDWWADGSGDVLMLRADENAAWRKWAKEPIQPEEPKNEERLTDAINACLAKQNSQNRKTNSTMKTYRINQFKTKEAVMDAIIEVFKRREDWTEAEARRTGINPEPTFKAQKAYDLAFQSMGGNSFRPGEYQKSKREMVDYLNNMESLFRDARLKWFRFYTQHTYLSTDAGKSEREALLKKINVYNASIEGLTNNFSRELLEFLEKNRNCVDWRVARYSEDSVTFGLVDAADNIDQQSLLTFYIDRGVTGSDEPTLVTSIQNQGRWSCEEVGPQYVRYAWMGLLLLDDRLKSLKEAMIGYGSGVKQMTTAISTANVQLRELGLADYEARFEEYERQNW